MINIPSERPDLHSLPKAPSDWIRQIELARLAAQRDDRTAAAIATAATLLLPRLDALIQHRDKTG